MFRWLALVCVVSVFAISLHHRRLPAKPARRSRVVAKVPSSC